MWGNTVRLESEASPDPDVVATPISKQLIKVDYRRPDTWSFFIGAGLTGGSIVAGTGLSVVLQVDLIVGVGRSVFLTQQRGQGDPNDAVDVSNRVAFVEFQWTVPVGAIPGSQGQNWKYVTDVQSPDVQDALGVASARSISWIAAQSIQAQCTFLKLATAAGQSVTAECSAFFAPRSHVRPDWYRVDEGAGAQFRGNEVGGT
jgi:hypothetical protein